MLLKIFGIILMIFGGVVALKVLFPLIFSIFGSIFLIGQLVVALILLYFGYRLFTRERDVY